MCPFNHLVELYNALQKYWLNVMCFEKDSVDSNGAGKADRLMVAQYL